tara:strand:- start:559 stop:939 length:381 start_codon:yes stop_codon:yes gene_type:complete
LINKIAVLGRFIGTWYVSTVPMIAVGLAIGSSVFFYAYPGKPKIAVIDILFTAIKVARLLTTVTGCSVFPSGQLAVSGHQRLRTVFGRPVIRRNIARRQAALDLQDLLAVRGSNLAVSRGRILRPV